MTGVQTCALPISELGGIVAERFSVTPEETLTLCGACLIDVLEKEP